jgi:CRP-like cAMP-binding protein
MAQNARERSFGRGASLVRSGEKVGSCHLIVEGRVRAEGGEHGGAELGPRNLVGYHSMLSLEEEELSAVAKIEATTLEIDFEDVKDMFEDQFEVLHHEIRAVTSRMLRLRMDIPDGATLAPAEGILEAPGTRLDLMDRVIAFTRGGAFGRSNMDAMVEVARMAEEVRFPPGRVLWKKGDDSGFLYHIVEGTARCAVEEGRAFRAGAGYPLGNLESLAGEPRWYQAQAETGLVALRSETDNFIDVLEDHFEMAMGLMSSFSTGLIRLLEERRRKEGLAD